MATLNEIRDRRSRKRIAAWAVVATAVTAGAGYWALRPWTPPAPVPVVPVMLGTVERTVSANARATYRGYYDLAFPFSGKIRTIAKEGDIVKKGQPIAELDAKSEKFAAEKARIALSKAQAELRVAKSGGTSAEEIRLYERRLEAARSDLEAATRAAWASVTDAESAFRAAEAESERAESALRAAETALERARSVADRNVEDRATDAENAFPGLADAVSNDLAEADLLLGASEANRNANDAFEAYLAAKDSSALAHAQASHLEAVADSEDFQKTCTNAPSVPDSVEIRAEYCLLKAQAVVESAAASISDAISALRASVDSPTFPQSSIDARIADFSSRLSDLRIRGEKVATLTASLESALGERGESVLAAERALDVAESDRNVADERLAAAERAVPMAKTAGEDAVKAAKNRVTEAQATLDWKRRPVPASDLAPFEKAVDSARKVHEEALSKVADAAIRSPVDGVVATVAKLAGSEIAANVPAITVVDTASPYVESEIEETEASEVRVGMAAKVVFDAKPETAYSGSVEFVSPTSSTDAKGVVNFRVRIRLSTETFPVAEGSVGTVEITVARAENVPTVPFRTVRKDDSGRDVVRSEDRGTDVVVKTGISDGKTVQILEGLSIGERVRN